MNSEELKVEVREPLSHVQISASGPTRFGGMISEEFLVELQWPRAYKAYDEMRKNSAVVGGFLRAIESAFRSARWYATPYDETPESIGRAKFLEECIYDMDRPWPDVLTDILTMLPFGFAPTEMVFKYRMGRDVPYSVSKSKHSDGLVGFKDFVLIPQNTILEWIYDLPDNPDILLGIKQLAVFGKNNINEIPITKVLNFRIRAEKNNPEGESILRSAYRDYYFQSNLEVVEAISLERLGAGIPVIQLPENATTIAQAQFESDEYKAQKVVSQVRADEQAGLVLPAGWEFSIVTAGTLRPELFDLAIKRHRASILMSVLAVFLEFGTARVGSNAMARTGRSFFEDALDGWVSATEQVINDKAVPLLFELNGITDSRLPKLSHASLAGEDLEIVVNALKTLVDINMVNPAEEALKNHVYHLLRFPRGDTITDGEENDLGANEEPPAGEIGGDIPSGQLGDSYSAPNSNGHQEFNLQAGNQSSLW